MGYCTTFEVGETIEKIGKFCEATNPGGSSNSFIIKDRQYFHEIERKNYDDDSTVTVVHRFVDGQAIRVGKIAMDSKGKVIQSPVVVEELVEYIKELQ